ncbi:c-type cytochrome [Methylocaldum sp.]|uniref:c-type cytochrome n=1 Tax=Methylocaldum sp. TaxID=1969727 RepID=UPI002D680BAE|nr:c-type cytochrome [Methylocaldum sp.]HYE36407.1 c-type cytochrome [Methylocaldum sp.]
MAPNRSITALFCVLALASCAESETKTSTQSTSRQPDYTRGRHVYNAFCAECHDSGQGGAPRLDDSGAWESRALGFPSLLTDHATNGFLDMPEKGARSDLSGEAVQDAVHYMIRQIASGE